jgi:iron complex outermembrane recepter protein
MPAFKTALPTAISAFALLALPAVANAQETEAKVESSDDFHSEDSILVTAPYFERLDFLAGTSALAAEELAEKSRGQIGDVLTSLPGVSATSFSPGASRPVLRGFQGSRVAVLTDGIGNIDASNTSADHAVTLDSLTIDRIEVLRGPAVLLFGGQAVGGAVNAIDKRIPRKPLDKAVHIDALGGFSTAADEYSAAGSLDVGIGRRLVLHIDGSFRDSDDLRSGGHVLSPGLRAQQLAIAAEERDEGNVEGAEEAEEFAALFGRIPNSAVRTWTLGSGLAFIDDGGNLGVSFNVYDTLYGVPARPGAEHAEEEEEGGAEEEGEAPVTIDLKQYRYDFRGGVNFGSGFFEKLILRAGFADYQHTEFEGDEVGTRFLSQGIEARAELVQTERNGWRGASGFQFQTRNFEAIGAEAFVPPNETQQIGIFTLQEFTLGNFEVEGALRYDRAILEAKSITTRRSFNNVSAALGLSWSSGDFKIGSNVSRTGRAPSAEELFSNGPHIATQAFEIGNVNLRSERSWNGEIYDANSTSFSATVFANRFSNFIYEDATGEEEDGLPIFQYFQDKARVWGVEIQGSARVAEWGSSQIIIDGVADYVHANITGLGAAPRIPPLRLLGGLEIQNGNFDIRGEVEWSDSQNRIAECETPTESFTLVNASASWRPWGREKNIALIFAANNLFDVSARRAASFTKDFVPLSGRDFRVTARFSF